MNQNLKTLGLAIGIMGALVGAPHAADSNLTVNSRRAAVPVGVKPMVGYVRATIVTPTAGASFDLPKPGGVGSVAEVLLTAETSSGIPKPLQFTRTATTVTVSGSAFTNGTMQVGDVIRAAVFYRK